MYNYDKPQSSKDSEGHMSLGKYVPDKIFQGHICPSKNFSGTQYVPPNTKGTYPGT